MQLEPSDNRLSHKHLGNMSGHDTPICVKATGRMEKWSKSEKTYKVHYFLLAL